MPLAGQAIVPFRAERSNITCQDRQRATAHYRISGKLGKVLDPGAFSLEEVNRRLRPMQWRRKVATGQE